MPKARGPLLSLRASGILGGHRRGPSRSRTLTSFVTADGKITGLPELFKSFNYGSSLRQAVAIVYSGADKTTWARALTRFDLSSLVGRSFSLAQFNHKTTTWTGNATNLRLSRIVNPADWIQSQFTWLNRSTSNPWSAEGADFDDAGPPAAIDFDCPSALSLHSHDFLLPFVEDALANRAGILAFLLRAIDEDPLTDYERRWATREDVPSNIPSLTLTP